jgi:phospho-N-acetylmuramoyl-pentapeptide-transferase
MLLLLLSFLQNTLGWHIPSAFFYCSTRMAFGTMLSVFLTIVLGQPLLHKLYEWKIGEVIRKEGCPLLAELHKEKQNTPTMGGILILLSLVLTLLICMDLTHVFTWILLLTTLCLGGLGAADDFQKLKLKNKKGISGRVKLAVQGMFSVLVVLYLLYPPFNQWVTETWRLSPPTAREMVQKIETRGPEKIAQQQGLASNEYVSRIYIPFVKEPFTSSHLLFTLFMALFLVVVLMGASNAVNLTDGLDGLAAGTVLMVAATFSIVAFISNNSDLCRYLNLLYIEGSGEIAIFLSAVCGACLGFLWYNAHPAQVFMGDTGSLALGGILGVSSILLSKMFLLALVGGIFVVEALSVMIQVGSFKLTRKRVFLCAPLHHHFEYKGWPEPKVVVRFWILGLLLAVLGILSLKVQ